MSARMRELFRPDWRVLAVAVPIALFMGLTQAVGYGLDEYTKQELPLRPHLRELAVIALIWTVGAVVALVPLFNWLRQSRPDAGAQGVSNRRFFVTSMVVLVGGWLPYLSLMWPGQATGDSFMQIRQALGQTPLSDHHPIFMTLVIKALLVPLKAVTGSVSSALGVISGLQVVGFAAIFAHSVTLLRRFRAPGGLYVGIVVFLALNPVVGWYSVSLWKDVWMGAFVLWAAALGTTLMADLWAGRACGWRRWLLFAAQLVLIAAAKKNGLYMVAALTLLLVAVALLRKAGSWRERLRTAAPVAGATVGALAVFVGVHSAVMSGLNVVPGAPGEAYSLPVQQMARIVKYHGDELTEQQKSELRHWFTGHNIGQRYVPTVSDTVKTTLNQEQLKESPRGLIALWWDLASDYPETALIATAEGTQGYWYPGVKYWMVSRWTWPCLVTSDAAAKNVDVASFDDTLVPVGDCFEGEAVDAAKGINDGLKSLPVVQWLFSLGAWTWAALILSGALLLLRRMAALPAVALMWLVWGTCMISPVFAEARYAYPMLLLLPVLLVLTLGAGQPVPAAAEPDLVADV